MAIINNNVQNVKFLRNQDVNITRDAAISLLNTHKDDAADGTALLARYTVSGTVKTIVGFVYVTGSTHDITIFDTEGASGDVESLRQEINAKLGEGITSENTATEQLAALSGATFTAGTSSSADTSVEGAKAYAYDLIGTLDYTDTAETGSYVSKVDQADGKITTTKVALPTVNAISETGKPITAVSESLGTISATAGTIEAQYVNIADSGEKFTATTVEGALAELDAKISGAVETLDYTDTAVPGEYVSQVTEENGVISVTRVALPSYSDTAITKQFVAAVDETNGEISVTRGEIQSSGKTVTLTADGNNVNFEVNIDNDTLQKNENGVISVTSSALVQYEGDGKTVQISAVQNGVRTVSSPLTISSTTVTDTNVKEQFNLVNASGETVGATIKIYKDSSLYNVYLGHMDDSIAGDPPVVTPGSGDAALCFIYHKEDGSYKLVPVNVETFLEETEFESGVTATNHIVHGVVDGTSEGFLTVGANGFKLAGVQNAIDTAVSGAVQTLDADVSGNTTHVTVNVVEADGVITGVNVAEDNIANASDLAALSAKTVTEVGSSNTSISATTASTANGTVSVDLVTDASKIKMSGFTSTDVLSGITSSSSITEAFQEVDKVITDNERVTSAALNDLDGRLDVIESDFISGITVNGSGVTVTDNIAALTIVSAASTGATESPIDVTTSNNGGVTLTFQGLDCGYYDGSE